MKKFLPTSYNFSVNKSIKNLEGFTLVELLVVISILAILSVLGYAVFSNLGAQAKARNNVRRSDIKSIASALEVNRGTVATDTYAVLSASQFSNNKIPSDPKTGNVYCANTTADAQPLDPAVVWTSTCPANYSTLGAAPLAGTKWKICVWLEVETNPAKAAQAFCMLSVQ